MKNLIFVSMFLLGLGVFASCNNKVQATTSKNDTVKVDSDSTSVDSVKADSVK